MKLLFTLILLSTKLWSSPTIYTGDFNLLNSTSAQCDPIFEVKHYELKHFLSGPSGLNSVSHLTSPNGSGFFHGLSIIGMYGGMGDIRALKEWEKDHRYYMLELNGNWDPNFYIAEFEVTILTKKQGAVICKAKAEYSGF